mmetsp:Transcript_5674/g.8229  ORF Transcript_5674/g.8229 Transcript_5674/m.8229 type:complete len:122 (-) Transcript_5674:46-411(-)
MHGTLLGSVTAAPPPTRCVGIECALDRICGSYENGNNFSTNPFTSTPSPYQHNSGIMNQREGEWRRTCGVCVWVEVTAKALLESLDRMTHNDFLEARKHHSGCPGTTTFLTNAGSLDQMDQ